jgi:hypothetical protein
VRYELADFNGASEYFEGAGGARWRELSDVLTELRPQLQTSDQAGRRGRPIFDPKATNASLTTLAGHHGWGAVPVPDELRPFGQDWDGGKGAVLAEWQFSNYPFLWNNIIRTEAIVQSGHALPHMDPIEALVVVTKSGTLPASNSTLYFEQARAQIDTVTGLGVFGTPIRLVGLTIDPWTDRLVADWNSYANRYGRVVATTSSEEFDVTWSLVTRKYGHRAAMITLPPHRTV